MKGLHQKIIVKRIFDLLNAENSNEADIIRTIESEFEIAADEAESILELTKTGLFRAHFIFNAVRYPANNLAKNPIVIEAQKLALRRLKQQKKKWWQFWKK